MRRLDSQVEAQRLEEDVFIVEYAVSPPPEVLALLVNEQIRVLLCDSATGHDELFHLTAGLFHFRCQEERSRSALKVMELRDAFARRLETRAHEEALEEDGCGAQSELRQLQQYANLNDEVHSFCPQVFLFSLGHAILDARRVGQLGLGEEPLGFLLGEDAVGRLGTVSRGGMCRREVVDVGRTLHVGRWFGFMASRAGRQADQLIGDELRAESVDEIAVGCKPRLSGISVNNASYNFAWRRGVGGER
jgi:hypothetical protein